MKRILLALLLLCLGPSAARAQFWVDGESGLVLGTRYNRVRIPNPGGTEFDLGKDLRANPRVFYRLRAGIDFGPRRRHTVTALYAPLTVGYEGAFNRPVTYNGAVFDAGEALRADYTFNSYRLTYRYALVAGDRLRLAVGLTGKIRDANVALRSDAKATNFDNVGFVPLLNLYTTYKLTPRWQLLLEADALASRFGRAEDVFLGAVYQVVPRVGVRAGYRVVEGGADNDQIYNFTWINYAAVGVQVRL